MRVSNLVAAFAAATLVASPVLAQGSASKLSLKAADVRASAVTAGASSQDDEGSGSGILIGLAAAVAVGLGIYFAVDGGDDDSPASN